MDRVTATMWLPTILTCVFPTCLTCCALSRPAILVPSPSQRSLRGKFQHGTKSPVLKFGIHDVIHEDKSAECALYLPVDCEVELSSSNATSEVNSQFRLCIAHALGRYKAHEHTETSPTAV